MTYDEGFGGYIPGNEITIDFQDPLEENNFFYINTEVMREKYIVKYVNTVFSRSRMFFSN